MNMRELPVKALVPNPDNPRTINEKDRDFLDLLASIKAIGVQEPIPVRTHPKRKDKFELLGGHRRHRAALLARIGTVTVIDYGTISDAQAFRKVFIENAYRQDLTPLEQGRAAVTALAKCGGDAKAAGLMLGESPGWVVKRSAVQESLAECWRKDMAGGVLPDWTIGHLAVLARFPVNVQEAWHKAGGKGTWPWSQCHDLSAVELEKEVAGVMSLLSKAPFDTSVDSKCATCPKRTSCQPMLWDEKPAPGGKGKTVGIKKGDRCLDRVCWTHREQSAAKRHLADMRKKYEGLLCISTAGFVNVDARRLKRIYGDYLSKQEYTIGLKADKGTKPALVIFGRDKGKVRYVKVRKIAAHKTPGQPLKQSPKVERANREVRRWHQVSNRFIDHLSSFAYEDLPGNKAMIVPLVASFYGANGLDALREKEAADYRKALEKASKKGPARLSLENGAKKGPANVLDVVLALLWKSVLHELSYGCGPNGSEEGRENMGIVATALKFDLRTWYNEAVAAETTTTEAKGDNGGKKAKA